MEEMKTVSVVYVSPRFAVVKDSSLPDDQQYLLVRITSAKAKNRSSNICGFVQRHRDKAEFERKKETTRARGELSKIGGGTGQGGTHLAAPQVLICTLSHTSRLACLRRRTPHLSAISHFARASPDTHRCTLCLHVSHTRHLKLPSTPTPF